MVTPGELQVDDKGADAFMLQAAVKGGQQHAGAQVAAVGDEGLAAVDDEFVPFTLVGGGGAAGIAAGIGLGQQETADFSRRC